MSWFGASNKKTAIAAASKTKPARTFGIEPQILGLGWLGMKVADVVALAVFMEEQLGLPFVAEGNTYAGHHVRYDCGALELELVSGGTAWATRPKPRRGQPDVPLIPSFSVDNIQPVAEQLNEKELATTQVFEQGWTASCYFFDPERNLWQVHEKRTEAAPGASGLQKLNTIWLACEDLAAQIDFYQTVLGLPLLDKGGQPRPITTTAENQPGSEVSPSVLSVSTDYPEPDNSVKIQQGAVFFSSGTHLALSPGGVTLAAAAPRVWGKDTPFLPGLLTNNLSAYADRLIAAGLKVSGPYQHITTKNTLNQSNPRVTQAIRFYDPEGQPWLVYG